VVARWSWSDHQWWLVVVWHSGSTLVSISEVNLCQAHYYWDGWSCPGSFPNAGHLSRYVSS